MKKEHHLIKMIAATILFMLSFGSVYSQNVISSVNISESAKIINEIIAHETETLDLTSNNSENWMSKKSYLENNSTEILIFMKMELNQNIYEEEQAIEDWMIKGDCWNLENQEIENWMLNDDFWIVQPKDGCANIEPWMLDDEFWVLVN